MRGRSRYWAAVFGAGLAGLLIGWTSLAAQADRYGVDWLFRVHKPAAWPLESAILSLDDDTYEMMNGQRQLRGTLAEAIERVAAVQPKAVVIDVTFSDAGEDDQNARLAAAIRKLGNVVLACEQLEGRWAKPLPILRDAAAALGHVAADPEADGFQRMMPLEKTAARERFWAMSLEAFRMTRNAKVIETPESLIVGEHVIPAPMHDWRRIRIRYYPPDDHGASRIPQMSVKRVLTESPELFRGKVVFVGATAQTATRDRLMTPYTTLLPMPGVEIHAHAYETLAQGRYLLDARHSVVLLIALALIGGAGFVFLRWTGLAAYLAGAAIIGLAHAMPHLFFASDIVFPFVAPVATAWFAVTCAAVWQYFQTRLTLELTEGERSRYQQAIQFVTHEMRTPLQAIQGSSELMNRYKLTEEKQKQLSQQIHTESKRLARMIQTYLDVERLSAGQMQLKREPFGIAFVVGQCIDRVKPLAERKKILIENGDLADAIIEGDLELMEYAVYNLLTNAVKYSPADTCVTVSCDWSDGTVSVAVRDQGMGMSEEDVKRIGEKFFRTKRAEQSGEAGTGIGLSIVRQIVEHHGGKLEVTSSLGKGSCFTMKVPAQVSSASPLPEMEK